VFIAASSQLRPHKTGPWLNRPSHIITQSMNHSARHNNTMACALSSPEDPHGRHPASPQFIPVKNSFYAPRSTCASTISCARSVRLVKRTRSADEGTTQRRKPVEEAMTTDNRNSAMTLSLCGYLSSETGARESTRRGDCEEDDFQLCNVDDEDFLCSKADLEQARNMWLRSESGFSRQESHVWRM
jgi:hypothetical protein